MSATIKGLLKGLRFIAQLFEPKEPEMQIGLPTDVKHVSHIGWDGSSANPPSWMNGFKSVEEIAKEPSNSIVESKKPEKKLTPEGIQDSKNEKPKQKSRRKSSTGAPGSPLSSPKPGTDGTKQSTTIESAFDSPRGSQRSNLSLDSSSQDPAGIPKLFRRKKPKQPTGSESGQKMKNKQRQQMGSGLEANEEEKG
ncbi:CRIB domain-containing protein RIC1 [Pistacia vera]|uniref:CRIB domain-containing protein RIC1 n=1 Tax=Pistacia vera TaxID=55513 RepID=UPI00126333D6|nr:CRIB domain-containing protein RIC1 [Pistacia vera]